jgi:hypothetical protein
VINRAVSHCCKNTQNLEIFAVPIIFFISKVKLLKFDVTMHSTSAAESSDADLRPYLQQNVDASWYNNLKQAHKIFSKCIFLYTINITVLKLATYFFPHALKTKPAGVAAKLTDLIFCKDHLTLSPQT